MISKWKSVFKTQKCEATEMPQWRGHLLLFERKWAQFSAAILNTSELPASTVPDNLSPSSDLHRHCKHTRRTHVYAIQTHISKKSKKKLKRNIAVFTCLKEAYLPKITHTHILEVRPIGLPHKPHKSYRCLIKPRVWEIRILSSCWAGEFDGPAQSKVITIHD